MLVHRVLKKLSDFIEIWLEYVGIDSRCLKLISLPPHSFPGGDNSPLEAIFVPNQTILVKLGLNYL